MPPRTKFDRLISSPDDDREGLEHGGPENPEAGAGWCSRALLLWVWSMIRLGRRRKLEPSDLWQLPPRDDPQRLRAIFKERWATQRREHPQRSESGKLFRVLWGAFQWRLVVSALWVVLSTACQFVWPTYINALVEYAQAAESSGGAEGEDTSIERGVSLAVQMLAWQVLGCLLTVQSDYALKKIGVACRSMMLTAVYEHMLHLPPQTRSSEEAASRGRLLSLLTQDATKVEQGIMFTHRAWVAPISVLAGLVYVFLIVGPATFAGFGFMCFGFIPVNKIKAAQQRWQRSKMQRTDRRTRLVEETFAAMKVIKYYGWERAQLGRLEDARNDELQALRKFKMLEAFSAPVNVTIPIITSVVTFIVYALLGNTITPAVAFTVVSLFQIIRNPFNQVPQTLTMYTQLSTSLSRLGELFQLPTTEETADDEEEDDDDSGDESSLRTPRSRGVILEIPESSGPGSIGIRFTPLSATAAASGESTVALCVESVVAGAIASTIAGLGPGSKLLAVQGESVVGWAGDLALRCLREHVQERPLRLTFSKADSAGNNFVLSLHRASFAWNVKPEEKQAQQQQQHSTSDRWLLQGLDLTVTRGSLVAIVGSVGSGKSSLLSALLGQMAQVSGDMSWSSEVQADQGIAYVSQEPFLISASVRDNILLGQPFDGGRYERVLRVCCLVDDLKLLADGEWTAVGERGVSLSGGQKARISMARALYRKASVVLMDDPLSAVDSHVGQSLMRDAIVDFLGQRNGATRLLVTNQLQLLGEAGVDQVVVMKAGAMVQCGSYAQVSSVSGAFKEMLEAVGKEKEQQKQQAKPFTELGEATPRERGEAAQAGPAPTATAAGTPRSKAAGGSGGGGAAAESSKTGAVSKSTFSSYAHAGAGGSWLRFNLLMGGFVLAECCFVTIDSWLSVWADDRLHTGPGLYIAVYAGLTVFYFTVTLIRSVGVASFGVASSRSLYADMQVHCLYCPMRLFDTVPMGRLLNRFTKDISEVDDSLAGSFTWFIMSMLRVISICSVIAAIQPVFLLGLLPIFKIYHLARQNYRCTSRELQRIESVSRSPLYSHCAETIDGAPTIAAHGDAPLFARRFRSHLRNNLRAFYAQQLCETWFSLMLQLLGGCIVGICALSMVLTVRGGGISAGLVGLALSYSNNIVINLNGMIFDWVRAETRMVGVERILEYSTTLPQESHAPPLVAASRLPRAATTAAPMSPSAPSAPSTPGRGAALSSPASAAGASPPGSSRGLPADWPRFGAVEFDSLCMRYDPTLPLVLSGVSFNVEAGTLVGVVGRTGSGKSSLFASLFRLVEPESGAVIIDGVDISSLSLSDLRPRLAIIPQEPVVFSGSVRENIDMFGEATDEEVWSAIKAAALEDVVAGLASNSNARGSSSGGGRGGGGGLDGLVEARGTNLSVGERQLLCLARAHLRSSKLLLLDEATASVDTVTDGKIQHTIRTDPRFSTATRVIIAHRLQTIIDADCVVVMDKGSVGEIGPPRELLRKHPDDEGAIFAGLAADSGIEL